MLTTDSTGKSEFSKKVSLSSYPDTVRLRYNQNRVSLKYLIY